jgi:two-component system, NarL family, response regulator FusR
VKLGTDADNKESKMRSLARSTLKLSTNGKGGCSPRRELSTNGNGGSSPCREHSTETHATKMRILVVDEHPLLRQGMTMFLNCQPDMIVCAEADSIPSAQIKIAESRPHLMVMGLHLGTGDTLEFIKMLKAQHPDLLILVFSQFEESFFAERALRAGANGYLMKKAANEELLVAIRDLLAGRIYVSRGVAMRAFQKSLEMSLPDQLLGKAPRVETLSDREMHVFRLIGLGFGNKKIAHALNLSVKTIESHRENIKRKLGLNSGTDLIVRAIKWAEANLLLKQQDAIPVLGKRKVVRFSAA